MLLNLTDVFTSEGKVKELSVPYEEKTFSYMGNEYEIKGDTVADMKLSNIGTGTVLVEGSVTALMIIPCDRCLKDVKVSVSADFAHQVTSPDQEKGATEEASDDTSDEEQNFVSGYELDTDALISNEILIHMPVKVLCKDDCKGICSVCGHDLYEGECGCDRFVPDPRMAAIKDIFNANKEV